MGCGCGVTSNVYKPNAGSGTAAEAAQAAPARGLPKVWNGPKPKQAAAKS